ncbi:MAG: hypothetical protein K940chlam7_01109 [Chlamydiae bacterium]|nr:hypothetical protein [Chlamydiota bacterium]
MSIPQQKFREIVFQFLFSQDLGQASDAEMILLLKKELSVSKKAVQEALSRARIILSKLSEIDELITETSTSYRFQRIQSVERNILRLGVYELLFDDTIPPKVAIAEAMRLSRKFSTPESATFVNALLDALYKSKIGKEVDEKRLSVSSEALSQSEEIANTASKRSKKQKDAKKDPSQ